MKRVVLMLLISTLISVIHAQEIDSIIDIRDEQVYKIVKIGQQWWMQENLNIGIQIDAYHSRNNGVIEKYCYNNNSENCKIYGGLYSCDEMMGYNPSDNENPGITQGICPVGWHLPTDSEWTELTDFLGGESIAGGKLKETGTTHWLDPNTGATNESGFTALPGGFGNLDYMGTNAYFWSSTKLSSNIAWSRELDYLNSNVIRNNYPTVYGLSVRCLRDSSQFSCLTISDTSFNTISKLNFTDDHTINTIVIINSGVGKTINVNSIHTNTSEYNLNKFSAVLSPGDSIHIKVMFNPPIKEGYYYDMLHIESNDPYNPLIFVPLMGYIPETDSIIDIRDNQIYKIVKIGQQWWMQENLNVGMRINRILDASNNGIIEKYCYDENDSYCKIYGGLYLWNEMMDYTPSTDGNSGITQGICPMGWHLPTNSEWTELTDFLGGESIAGGKLKEMGTTHWKDPNTDATNESGFTALPGGARDFLGEVYFHMGATALFWSSTAVNTSMAWDRILYFNYSEVNTTYDEKRLGMSVRCIRDFSKFNYLNISDTNFRKVSNLNFYGDNTKEQLIIFNLGAGKTIKISSIYTNNSAFSLNKSSSNLSPADSIHLTISFNAPVKGIYLDTLYIKSDDLYDSLITIPLNGTFPLELTFTDSNNISCFGYSNGSATVTPSLGTPPYFYQWDDAGNTTDSIVTGLSANIYYHVYVVDSKGYLVSDSIILSEPKAITIFDTIQDVSITGGSDGIIDITITGGTKPYIFNWSNDSTSEDLIGITTGEYSLMVEDHNDCIKEGIFRVKEPITLQFDKTDVSCYGINDGIIDMTIFGGNQPYTIEWSNGATTEYVNNLYSGKYIVIVTDYFGTSVTGSVDITEPEPLTILYDYSEEICLKSNDGFINLNLSGGVYPYSYSWSNGNTTQNILNIPAGDYSVVVTDSLGCQIVHSFTIAAVTPYKDEEICLVTVDPETGKNLIIWNRTSDKNIEAYILYRETSVKDVYDSIGVSDFSNPGFFIDNNSNPTKQSYRYKLSIIDTCGNESNLSTYHATMHLTLNIGINGVTNLIWTKYEGFDVQTYNIWRGSNKNEMFIIGSVSGNNSTFTDQYPLEGTNIYQVEVISLYSCNPENLKATYSSSFSNYAFRYSSGIKEIKENRIIITPNPFNESTILTFNNTEGSTYALYIADITGKVCRIIQDITSSEYLLEKEDLKEGLYIIELRGPKIYRGKIVIE